MDTEKFKQNFNGYELPHRLMLLNEFENQSEDYFSESFELVLDQKYGLKTWSEHPDFLDGLLPFAQANGSGSIYAIWNTGATTVLDDLPIVVFGDEGGYHVVAINSKDLLQLLSFDTEITVYFDTVYFYKDPENEEESPELDSYKAWIKKEFNLDPVGAAEAETILEQAQARYKDAFETWVGQYFT